MFHFPVPFCGRSPYSSGRSGGCWRGTRLRLLPWKIKSMKSCPSMVSTARTTRKTSRTRTWRAPRVVVVRTAGFRTGQRMSLTRCCSSVSRKCRLLSAITRLISSESSSSDEIMPCSQSSREHWVQRFFAVGPISTLGLVGDSGRTDRSLSAASKPRIYPTHGAEHSIHPGRRRGTYFQGA